MLAGDESLHGGQVLIDTAGTIVCAACDCDTDALAQGATRITCANGVISPALINSHDHVTFDQLAPYAPSGTAADERYEHRHDWRRGSNGHNRIASPSGGNAATRMAELRHLLGGATSINGSGSVSGLLRNLDKVNDREGLSIPAVAYQTFPLGDSGGQTLTSGCAYPSIDNITDADIASSGAYTPHVSEGINLEARNEFLCMSSAANGGHDLAYGASSFIHGIGLRPEDLAVMGAESTGLIWSPRSNISLYGHTAQVTLADALGVEISLGTDWTPSGSINLLRELRCADSLNRDNFGGYFTDKQLWEMVTYRAARLMAVDTVLGRLRQGLLADVAIFSGDAAGGTRTDWRAVIAADTPDVVLVLRAGQVMTGDDTVVAALPTGSGCETVDMCGISKRVCAQRETGSSFSTIVAAASLYAPFFCGTPTNEPTCVPVRPAGNVNAFTAGAMMDRDGDGVPDATDNCPDIFNPIRPLDGNAQADADADMEGDVCDPCPLTPNAQTCARPDPDDVDADGIPDITDNCPGLSNPLQEDRDNDLKGDACDACPDISNPGNQACPVAVYAVKQGTATGPVSLNNMLVTAVGPTGFFCQTVMGDADYDSALAETFSAVFAYTGSAGMKPAAGDRVDITNATAADYFGQKQLSNVTFVVLSQGNVIPDPLDVADPSTVATGGGLAEAMEGLLLRVNMVQVTEVEPTPGTADMAPTFEYVVTGGLRVNDYLYHQEPLPMVMEDLDFVTGILRHANDNKKLEPRSAADVGNALQVIALEPTDGFVDEGGTVDLTATLNRPVTGAAATLLLSSDAVGVLDVPATVTVPVDGVSAMFTATAGTPPAPGTTATITATLDASSRDATFRVVGAAETPQLLTLTPMSTTASVGGMVLCTVELDIPARAGGAMVAVAVDTAGTLSTDMVAIAAGARDGSFTFLAGAMEGTATITATLGNMLTTQINVSAATPGRLVINEVDYDQPGSDAGEFVEIYNAGGMEIPLDGIAVIAFNGNGGAEVVRVALSGPLASGAYAVVANTGLMGIDPGAVVFQFPAATDNLQNGAPDGVALYDTVNNVLLDGLSYEGAMAPVTPMGAPAAVNLVEGTALATAVADSNAAAGSLIRDPNGSDTNDANTDWKFTTTATPGAPNVSTP